MTQSIYITGLGIVCPLGIGRDGVLDALRRGHTAIRTSSMFSATDETDGLPVGVCEEPAGSDKSLPRAHRFAIEAAKQAVSGNPPDAIVIGTTTGGMDRSEAPLAESLADPEIYRNHGASTIATTLAEKLGCTGPVITVSTACSGGAVSIALAAALIRQGFAKRILAGGADGLCGMVYHGFSSLQLIDPQGARPFCKDRQGMTVAEGAGMLLLESGSQPPKNAMAMIAGAGLSCDAYHPTAPEPKGKGALAAMRRAIEQAGIETSSIDYINLHGTGTIDNDRAEAIAVSTLLDGRKVAVSSIKGASGHSLGAAGAIEAAVCALCLDEGFIPGNIACPSSDQDLPILPVASSTSAEVKTVLSNSFGFGGNNAAIALSHTDTPSSYVPTSKRTLFVEATSCISGAGMDDLAFDSFFEAQPLTGRLDETQFCNKLDPRKIRRIKRLPRMLLSMATSLRYSRRDLVPDSIFFGTAFGPQSETNDFLQKLFASNGRFGSPMDFIGSVNNAPAGTVAMELGATGPNVTCAGGNFSFEQSVFAACALGEPENLALLAGADEAHELLSPRFDASVALADKLSDGGGAMLVRPCNDDSGLRLRPLWLGSPSSTAGCAEAIEKCDIGLVMAGFPLSCRRSAMQQCTELLSGIGYKGPLFDYRKHCGEYGSVSALAAVLALRLLQKGYLPFSLSDKVKQDLTNKSILLLGFGNSLSAIEARAD